MLMANTFQQKRARMKFELKLHMLSTKKKVCGTFRITRNLSRCKNLIVKLQEIALLGRSNLRLKDSAKVQVWQNTRFWKYSHKRRASLTYKNVNSDWNLILLALITSHDKLINLIQFFQQHRQFTLISLFNSFCLALVVPWVPSSTNWTNSFSWSNQTTRLVILLKSNSNCLFWAPGRPAFELLFTVLRTPSYCSYCSVLFCPVGSGVWPKLYWPGPRR
jgi:hypothetical protein